MPISTVKLVISFCANAKFKDIACIVNHHYHIFHVPQQFYIVNKSCSNHLSITHDPQLCKHCILSDPLTLPRGRFTGEQEIHREYDFHSLHCVYRNRLLTFSHILDKYLGATRRPRYIGPSYNGVAVYQGILPILLSNFGCVSYTRVLLIHRRIWYTEYFSAQLIWHCIFNPVICA